MPGRPRRERDRAATEGLRAVLFDVGFSPPTERWITRVLVAIWIVTVGYGLWLTSAIAGWT